MLLSREKAAEMYSIDFMNYQETTQPNGLLSLIALISRYRWFVLVVTIFTTAAFYGVNVTFNEFEYRSDAEVMVVQYSDNASVDGEKTQRSTENISRNLTKVIGTSSFIDKALANPTVPAGMITGNTDREKKDSWNNTVTASTLPNSSIIQVSVYDTDPEKAAILAQAVVNALIASAAEYHGANKYAIELKQVDKVLTSDTPVRPNIPTVTAAGFFIGLIGSIVYLVLVKEWKLFTAMSQEWRRASNAGVQDVRRASQLPQTDVAAPVVASTPVDVPEVALPVAQPVPVLQAMQEVEQKVVEDVVAEAQQVTHAIAMQAQHVEQEIVEEAQAIEQAVVQEVEQVEEAMHAIEYRVLDHLSWKQVLPLNVLQMHTAPQVVTIPQPIA